MVCFLWNHFAVQKRHYNASRHTNERNDYCLRSTYERDKKLITHFEPLNDPKGRCKQG
jgi:hypothetical protein